MIQAARCERGNTVLAVVDIQERLLKAMDPSLGAAVVKNVGMLCDAMAVFGIPVLATEQYPRGLGPTIAEIKTKIAVPPLEKLVFSSCREERFQTSLKALKKTTVLLTGMEAHVCVYQTCLDLLEAGYSVQVVRNGVASRSADDWSSALHAMERAGAWITTAETAVFQILGRAGTDEFKKISALVK